MKANRTKNGFDKPLKNRVAGYVGKNKLQIAGLAVLITIALIISCAKSKQAAGELNGPGKLKVNSAQPLPQGKANFSVTMGHFATTGRIWVRIINWTFNASAGTIAATSWTWFSDVKTGTGAFVGGSHTCTLDGVTSTCENYVPAGWNTSGASIHQSWSGAYTYNTTTHALHIDWATIDGAATDATEDWDVSLPLTGLARVSLTGSNYTLTHGHGYGSNAAWTVFKNISQIVAAGLPNYSGPNSKNVYVHDVSGTRTFMPATVGFNTWNAAAFNIVGSTTPSNPTPAVTLHHWTGTTMCSPLVANGGNCTTSRVGSVTHFTVSGTNRQVGYSIFCACLPTTEWPCYTGNRHPHALMQIIDDSGTLQGYIGIEAQNKSGYSDFQFQCEDFTNIP